MRVKSSSSSCRRWRNDRTRTPRVSPADDAAESFEGAAVVRSAKKRARGSLTLHQHFLSAPARSRWRAAPTVPASVAGCSREAPALHVNTPRASSARVDSAQGPQLCVAPCSFHRATDSAAGSRSRVARTRSAGACGAAPARLREVAWGIAVSEAAAPLDMGFIHDRREWAPSPPVRRCRQSPDRRRPR